MATTTEAGGGAGGVPSLPAITYAARPPTSSRASSSTSSRAAAVARRRAAQQAAQARGTDGTALVANDAGGFGLNRPYLGWNTYPTAQETTPPQSTSSGSFVSLLTASAEPQHPRIRVRFRAITGAGTSGEVRLRDRATGQVIAGPFVVGTATTVENQLEGALVNPTLSGAGAPMKVDVEARITAGASTIAVLILYAIGKGG